MDNNNGDEPARERPPALERTVSCAWLENPKNPPPREEARAEGAPPRVFLAGHHHPINRPPEPLYPVNAQNAQDQAQAWARAQARALVRAQELAESRIKVHNLLNDQE